MNKITVIHHSADFDGLFCREIAKKFLGTEGVKYIGWDYGDGKVPFPTEGQVYVMDLSPECFEKPLEPYEMQQLIWIDHHKSAIEKFSPAISGYRIDGVAACRLAWQWFITAEVNKNATNSAILAKKSEFVDRLVSEPYAVQLAGEYDIWGKRNPDAETFQLGLRSQELTPENWSDLLKMPPHTAESFIGSLLNAGDLLQRYVNQRDAFTVNALGFLVEFEGLKFLALNSAGKGSLQFAAKDVPETGHDALLKFNWTGNCWDVSLYHAKHRTELDLSAIAAKFGGGGHRGACGFRSRYLPFFTDARALPQSTDAQVWAKDWLHTISVNPSIPTDEGTMITWFANAIMAGYDEARRKI